MSRYSRAMHLVTTGAVYPANHPLLDSLFSETVEKKEDVVTRALEVAEEIVRNTSVVSFALMRDLMYRGPGSAEATHLLDSRLIHEIFEGEDNQEGIKAFLEKRPVRFTGTMEKNAPGAYPWWNELDTREREGVVKKAKL